MARKSRTLPHDELNRLCREGGYEPMYILGEKIGTGDVIEVLDSYGEVKRYTVINTVPTGSKLQPKMKMVWAWNSEGIKTCLCGSMTDCYNVGWKFHPTQKPR